MEQFRALLKNAIAANATRICITPGERSEWTLVDGSLPVIPEIPPFDIATVNQLLGFLLPDFAAQKDSSLPVTGTLQIPNFGLLKLIGKKFKDSAIIYLYTPSGDATYASDLLAMNNKAKGIPAPPVGAHKLPPIPVPAATDDGLKLVVKKSGESETPAVAPSRPPAVPDPGPPPALSFGKISASRLYSASLNLPAAPIVAAPEPATLSPPPIPEIKVAADQVSFDIPPLDTAFAPDANGVYMASQPVPSQVIAPTAAEILQINFGNNAASEGSVSHGENPIDELLVKMVKKKASDMHLTMGQPVVFRVHGEIERDDTPLLTSEYMEKLLLPTMPKRNHDEFASNNDTDFAYELKDVGRFRVNVFRDCNGTGAVMRHIPSQILTAQQLNLSPAIMNFCKLNKGLVLVTGPTGSGKSTTLAAMLDWINKNRAEHILTIEDPIEFVHPQYKCLVNQREVHKHTKGFSRALKAALREDPDVILIGEMRDLETISIAIETAETGHLVFGTLHTTTAISTVDRIIDQFPADRQAQIRTMLSSSLRGVVAQTLVKKKGGGRVAAQEVLVSNDAVAAMVREGKTHMLGNHMLTQKSEGNILLNEALFKLIAEDLIDPQEALFKAVDKNDFLLAAARRNIKVA